jgi:hypothetical protein
MKRFLTIVILVFALPLASFGQAVARPPVVASPGVAGVLPVDTSGNPTTTLNLSGSNIAGGLTLGGHPVIDDGGNIFYRTGIVLANYAGNINYSTNTVLADTHGNLYYGNGEQVTDANGSLYYGNGDILADSSGKLYTSTGQIVTGGPATFPFAGPVYSPSSGGTPAAETGAQAAVLLSGQTPALANIVLSASTLTYSATQTLDFSASAYQNLALTGGVTLASSNLAVGRAITVLLTAASTQTLAFPAGWIFIGAAAPASLAAGKTAILSLTSFGTTNANVIAAYSAQP